MTIDYSGLPLSLQGGFKRYIEEGVQAGHFIMAVCRNDLMGAFGHADLMNQENMKIILEFVYNQAPFGCWGSVDDVKHWIARGGLKGNRVGYTEAHLEGRE